MRARNIKPGFFENEHLCLCEPLARILFAGLWCIADRDGRLEDRPLRIKQQLLGYDECDIHSLLDQLATKKNHSDHPFIVRYEVDGRRFIQITNFEKHQNPHVREAKSTIPEYLPVHVKHSASTVLEQCEASPPPCLATLIPDSGFLIPDSRVCEKTANTYSSVTDDPVTKPVLRSAKSVSIDYKTETFTGITEAKLTTWRAAYPAVDIDGELLRAAQWAVCNPSKRKSRWDRFLVNWFARVQERGGNGASRTSEPQWVRDVYAQQQQEAT